MIFAREYRGYSQSDLAKNIEGLSQSNLSKFEKGLSTLSEELTERIFKYLDFPSAFFFKKISNTVENPHYRKRATIGLKTVTKIELNIRLIGYVVDQLADSIEWPDFELTPFDLEDGYTPETVAKYTRKLLGLNQGEPVDNIFQYIEEKGVIIVEVDLSDKFDGASIQTDRGYPVIIINKSFSNDRKRFTLAHELGHLIMHVLGGFPIPDIRDAKEKENEANRFASEFLMPKDFIKDSLLNLKLGDLATLKRTWLTSMASITYRAYNLECIDQNRYRYFNIEMSRLGLKKDEGYDVHIDSPNLFKSAYLLHRNELEFSDESLAKAFALPTDVTNFIFNQTKKQRNHPTLRIVV